MKDVEHILCKITILTVAAKQKLVFIKVDTPNDYIHEHDGCRI